MPQLTEGELLAETFDYTRKMTKFMLSKLVGVDVNKRIELEGKEFNSIYWFTAHTTWAEHNMLVVGMGKPSLEIPWLNDFKKDSNGQIVEGSPSYEDVLKAQDAVHEASMNNVKSLTTEDLDSIAVNSKATKRTTIMHAIRHEGMHGGQIAWLCKMNGIKTF